MPVMTGLTSTPEAMANAPANSMHAGMMPVSGADLGHGFAEYRSPASCLRTHPLGAKKGKEETEETPEEDGDEDEDLEFFDDEEDFDDDEEGLDDEDFFDDDDDDLDEDDDEPPADDVEDEA